MPRPIQNQHIIEFLEYVSERKSQRTLEVRESCLRKLDKYIEEKEIDLLDPPEKLATNFLLWVDEGEDYADTYMGSIKDSCSRLFTYLNEKKAAGVENSFKNFSWKEGLLNDVNPQVPEQEKYINSRPNLEGRKALRLEKDDVKAIWENVEAPTTRNELLVRLIWQTTLRTSEVASIEIKNVDWDKREIVVQSAKTDEEDDHHYRTVYYSASLDPLLRNWLESRRALKYSDSDKLFITDQSPKMRPSHISRIVKVGAKNAEINVKMGNGRWLITGHTLRHASITYYANETDLELHHIADIAGHAQLETTRDYIQTTSEELRQEVQRNLPE